MLEEHASLTVSLIEILVVTDGQALLCFIGEQASLTVSLIEILVVTDGQALLCFIGDKLEMTMNTDFNWTDRKILLSGSN